MVQKQQRKSSTTIASIQTEYVHSLQKKEDRKNARKVRLYRRLTVFAIAALLLSVILRISFIKQKKALAVKEQEKSEMLAEAKRSRRRTRNADKDNL